MIALPEITPAGYFIYGAATMASFAIALFFFKHYLRTRDRLLAYFGIAFALIGVERIGLLLTSGELQAQSPFYFMRLIAFLLIIFAIVDKNRRQPQD